MKKSHKSRKAFTLAELLVAVAVSAILLAAVAATLIFVLRSTDKAEDAANMTYKARTVRDYILSEDVVDEITKDDVFEYSQEERTLKDVERDKIIVSEALYMKVTFIVDEDNFLVCTIEYKTNKDSEQNDKLTFVVKKLE